MSEYLRGVWIFDIAFLSLIDSCVSAPSLRRRHPRRVFLLGPSVVMFVAIHVLVCVAFDCVGIFAMVVGFVRFLLAAFSL